MVTMLRSGYRSPMPVIHETELAATILNGKIGAISLDTSIFDRYQCNFQSPALSALEQFREKPVKLLISEIVAREVKAHLERDALKSQRDMKSAIATHLRCWNLDDSLVDPYLLSSNAAEFASEHFDDFVEQVGADIVVSIQSAESAKAVLERYFDAKAPFENSQKKKYEFPDAFALVSLEEWARTFDTQILCVSTDTGWQEFASTSPYLICVEQLDRVLDQFNELGRAVATKVVGLLQHDQAPKVLEQIESAFQYRLDTADFDVSVEDSPTAYEFEQLGAELRSLDWSITAPNVLDEDEETVTFSINVRALVEFHVSFTFYIRDSIDRDDVHLGSRMLSSMRWVPFDLAVTIWRDMSADVEAVEVTVDSKGMTALFQRIDPFSSYDGSHTTY